jgi:GT2 family glycosyltransferase
MNLRASNLIKMLTGEGSLRSTPEKDSSLKKQKLLDLLTGSSNNKTDLITVNNSLIKSKYYTCHYSSELNKLSKKIISIPVYGDKNVYLLGAEKNIEIAGDIYPDWIVRIYCTQDIKNLNALKKLASEGHCELFVLESDIFPMYWRYFAIDDPKVSHAIFRDSDSIVDFKEKAAVEDWVKSGATLHSMHDHASGHWSPIMGGMCGLKNPISFNMVEQIHNWSKSLRNHRFAYSDDQSFLSKYVLPIYENDMVDHDSNFKNTKLKKSQPFPTHVPNVYSDHVGARTSAFQFIRHDNLEAKDVFVAPHLGPTDYIVVRDCVHAIINKFNSVVIPVKPNNEVITQYMFGGHTNVSFEIIADDHECFDLFVEKFSQTHRFIGLGINGPHSISHGRSWGSEVAFEQAGLEFQKNIFKTLSNPNFNYSKLKPNLKTIIDNHSKQSQLNLESSIRVSEDPLVTAIVSTFNRFDYLLNTIDSIKKQTYKNIEIIVVNDKSTQEQYYKYNWKEQGVNIIHLDPSSKEVIGYPVPGGFQRNFGMESSKGDYFAFCDDDDIWLPKKLEIQIPSMIKNNCKMSCTDGYRGKGSYDPKNKYRLYNKDVFFNILKNKYKNTSYDFSLHKENFPEIWDEGFFKRHNCAICSSVVIHKSIFGLVGKFTPMKAADDYEYWRRVIKHTNCNYVDKPLMYYDAGHAGGIQYSWA